MQRGGYVRTRVGSHAGPCVHHVVHVEGGRWWWGLRLQGVRITPWMTQDARACAAPPWCQPNTAFMHTHTHACMHACILIAAATANPNSTCLHCWRNGVGRFPPLTPSTSPPTHLQAAAGAEHLAGPADAADVVGVLFLELRVRVCACVRGMLTSRTVSAWLRVHRRVRACVRASARVQNPRCEVPKVVA